MRSINRLIEPKVDTKVEMSPILRLEQYIPHDFRIIFGNIVKKLIQVIVRTRNLDNHSLQDFKSKLSKFLEDIEGIQKNFQEARKSKEMGDKFRGLGEGRIKWYELHSERTEKSRIGNNRGKKEKNKKNKNVFKIVLAGDLLEAKTDLIQRTKVNIGVDFIVKNIEINGKKIKLQIWDVGGEERLKFLLPTHIRGANGAIIMYDSNKAGSLKFIFDYIEIINKNVKNIPIFLAVDESLSKVEKIEDFTDKYSFTDISSEIGQKGEYVFELLTKKVLEYESFEE